MQNSKKTFLSVITISLLATILLTGCGPEKPNLQCQDRAPGDPEQMRDRTGPGSARGTCLNDDALPQAPDATATEEIAE